MGAEIVAVRFDNTDLNEKKNFRPRIVKTLIPQFTDNLGVPAAQWAQLYIKSMEKELAAGNTNQTECQFIFDKIREQYPDVKSGVFAKA